MKQRLLEDKHRWRNGLGCFMVGCLGGLMLSAQPYHRLIQPVQAQSARIADGIGDSASLNPIREGLSFYRNGDFVAAIRQWEQGLSILQKKGQVVDAALTLNYLALAYQELGQSAKAEVLVNQGLQQLALPQIQNRTSLAVLARLFNTRGSLQLAQGRSQLALESWQNASRTYRQIGDRTGETGSLINQAQAEQALGYFLRARHSLGQAEQMISAQTDPSIRLPLAINLGQTLSHIGEFGRAKTVLADALKIAQHQNEAQSITALLLQQGNLAYAQQRFKPALTFYQQALDVSDRDAAKIRAETRVEIELNRLRVLLELQQWDAAQALWPNIKSVLDSFPLKHDTLFQKLQLADGLILLQSSQPKPTASELAQLLSQIAQQAQTLKDPRAESFALGYLGQLYERNQQGAEAESVTRKALVLAQSTQSSESLYRWEWQLGRIARSQGKIAAALQSYQQAVDTLQTMRKNLVSLNPTLQYSFRDQVEPVYREYVDLLLQSPVGQQPTPKRLKQAEQTIESLRVAELDYFLRSACLEARQPPPQQALEPGTAILYPIVLRDRLATLVNLPDGSLQVLTQPIKTAALETTVQTLRIALEKPYTAPEGKILGTQLYQLLIAPVQKLLAQHQIKTLVFVPDGPLRNIPLAALYDGKRFLIEQYQVAISPSLKLLASQPRSSTSLKTLAAGVSKDRNGFGPLPFVADELKAVIRDRGGKVLLNEQFTTRAIANAVNESSVNIVHLASHGQFSSNVDQTFIQAWDKPITLSELKDLLDPLQQRFHKVIDLLVLSACETATGDNRAALGLAGVAVQVGTPSTMATLWGVDDQSSSLFMEAFYNALSQPRTSKAEALRQTQLKFLKDKDYRHPFHWAAYVLVGNWL